MLFPPVCECWFLNGLLISDGFVSIRPKLLCPTSSHLFLLSIRFFSSISLFLPISSGAANTDGSYHGMKEKEMVSMRSQCLSQHEPRPSTKHKQQIAKCLTPGQLDFCSLIWQKVTFTQKASFWLKNIILMNFHWRNIRSSYSVCVSFCQEDRIVRKAFIKDNFNVFLSLSPTSLSVQSTEKHPLTPRFTMEMVLIRWWVASAKHNSIWIIRIKAKNFHLGFFRAEFLWVFWGVNFRWPWSGQSSIKTRLMKSDSNGWPSHTFSHLHI